jgi:hypothetical protein
MRKGWMVVKSGVLAAVMGGGLLLMGGALDNADAALVTQLDFSMGAANWGGKQGRAADRLLGQGGTITLGSYQAWGDITDPVRSHGPAAEWLEHHRLAFSHITESQSRCVLQVRTMTDDHRIRPFGRRVGQELSQCLGASLILSRRDDQTAFRDINRLGDISDTQELRRFIGTEEFAGDQPVHGNSERPDRFTHRDCLLAARIAQLTLRHNIFQVKRICIGLIGIGLEVAEEQNIAASLQLRNEFALTQRGWFAGIGSHGHGQQLAAP